ESGKTVKGTEIPGLQGNDMLLEQFCGKNTEIAGNAIVASINGIVKFEDNRYTVEKELKLNCDIGVETGAINIPKDLDITLIIDGDVQDGYTVTCPTLKISGCVEDSTVDVNNLYIDNGIVGTSDKPIRADVLRVGYINGTRKVFAHTIKVQREISNGASITADTLQVNTIQGSYVMAKEGILVDYIKGVNHITVGIDYDLKKEFDDVANEMKVFENEINEMKNESYKIAKKMEKMRQLAKINPKNPTLAVEMKKIKEFKEKFDSRTKYYNELEEKKKDRAKKMYLFNNHFLVVKSGFSTDTSSDQSVEPDTNLRICTHIMKVNRPTSGGLFKANESKINFSSKYNLKEIKDIIENKFKYI
ncbi:DUF342 domain-containing protein, partial [bacterium]|nr:DUF342 domain-containing protein [bacterium]